MLSAVLLASAAGLLRSDEAAGDTVDGFVHMGPWATTAHWLAGLVPGAAFQPAPRGLVPRVQPAAARLPPVTMQRAADQHVGSSEEAVSGLTQAERAKYMRAMSEGVDSGGWDNDDYLQNTKTAPQSPAIELYRQAMAHKAALEARGDRPSRDQLIYYDELKADLTPDEIEAVESGAYDPGWDDDLSSELKEDKSNGYKVRQRDPVAKVPAPPPAPSQKASMVSESGGVASGTNFAALLAQTQGKAKAAPAAPAPAPAPAPPVASVPPPAPPPPAPPPAEKKAPAPAPAAQAPPPAPPPAEKKAPPPAPPPAAGAKEGSSSTPTLREQMQAYIQSVKDRGVALTAEQKAMIKEFEAEEELLDQRGLVDYGFVPAEDQGEDAAAPAAPQPAPAPQPAAAAPQPAAKVADPPAPAPGAPEGLLMMGTAADIAAGKVADPPAPAPGAPEGLLMMGTAADIAAGKVTPQPVPASPVVNVAEKAAAPEEEEPPLPDKDPADLRKQYLNYLETFSQQRGDGRTMEPKLLKLITRLAREKPPTPAEEEQMVEIRVLERKLGIDIHDDGTSPLPEVEDFEDFEVEETAEQARFRGYREVDNQPGPRAQRYKDVLAGKVAHDAPPPAPPPAQPAPPPEPVAAAAPAAPFAATAQPAAQDVPLGTLTEEQAKQRWLARQEAPAWGQGPAAPQYPAPAEPEYPAPDVASPVVPTGGAGLVHRPAPGLREALQALSLSELRARARNAGMSDDEIEDIIEYTDSPRQELVERIYTAELPSDADSSLSTLEALARLEEGDLDNLGKEEREVLTKALVRALAAVQGR